MEEEACGGCPGYLNMAEWRTMGDCVGGRTACSSAVYLYNKL